MGQLSANMLAALNRSDSRVLFLAVLELPGGDLRVGQAAYSSLSEGHFEGRLLSWDGIEESLSDDTGALEGGEWSIQIADIDQEIDAEVEGANGHQVEGSAATLYLAHPELAPADWYTVRTGVIAPDGLEKKASRIWDITCRPDDAPLQALAGPSQQITLGTWPRAHERELDKYAPLIWGKHSAPSGALPALLVDQRPDPTASAKRRYLVGQGWYQVPRILEDGVISTKSTTVEHRTLKGVQYTTILFDSAPGEDVAVTVDVEGFEDVGDATGDLMEAPTDLLAHVCNNFGWGTRWKRGDFLTGQAPLDATSLAATASKLAEFGFRGARYLDKPAKLGEIIDAWTSTWPVYLVWLPNNTLAVLFDEHRDGAYVSATIRPDMQGVSVPEVSYRSQLGILDGFNASYLQYLVADEQKSQQELSVRDESSGRNVTEDIDLPWLTASLG